MLHFAISAVCFISALLLAIVWRYSSTKKVTTIPGLDQSNTGGIARAGSLHQFLMGLHKQFGPIAGFWFGPTYTVSIASPELFKQHANVFDRPSELVGAFRPYIGKASIHQTNGPEAKIRRKQYDRAFSHARLRNYYELFQKATDLTVKRWNSHSAEDYVPLMEDMFIIAVQVALQVVLGDQFNDDKRALWFRNANQVAWDEVERRGRDPILPSNDSPRMKQFNEALQHINNTIQKVVDHRKDTQGQGNLIIDDVMEYATTDEMVKKDTLTFFVAGFHTTAMLMTWCLYYLAKHRDVQEKLYSEIQAVLGSKGEVNQSNINKLKYMKQVLDESLRCSLVTPWVARYSDSELGGHRLPKNTPVIQALGVVLHDETIWPEPHTFDPDRFNAENSKGRHHYAFQPFGFAGKRMCPASRYTYVVASVVVATILQNFEIKMRGDQDAVPVYGIVTCPAEEIWVQLVKRI